MLQVRDLQTGFRSKTTTTVLLSSLDFEVTAGELCVILGRNGSGKTTLLRTIAGLHPALKGTVEFTTLTPIDTPAKHCAIVTTERFRLSYFRVADVVALGRYPHTGYFGNLQEKDKEIIEQAIELTDINHLINKPLAQLSDGEYQKVMIARALAQDTPLLLLDEPTAHLDIVNRIGIFHLLKKISSENGKAILCTTHEVELALQTADKIILLDGQGKAYIGTPTALIEQGYIEAAYSSEQVRFDVQSGRFEMVR